MSVMAMLRQLSGGDSLLVWQLVRTFMRSRVILGLLCISVMSSSGCFIPANLIAVSGPAVLQPNHHSVIKPSGAFSKGRFYADFQEDRAFGNDQCKGRWKAATPPKPISANDMASAWDTVYGDGYYSSRLLAAKRCARGSGLCKKRGIVLEVEICEIENGQGTKNRKNMENKKVAVGRDDKGSFYKIECMEPYCNGADFQPSNEVSR